MKVFGVVEESAAQKAGLSENDIIRKIDGKEVTETKDFIAADKLQ